MSPHEILGVRPGAPKGDVADAFRRYARRHHPDRGGDAATFRAGVDAYRRLTAVRPGAGAGVDLVFHRRPPRRVPALLTRLARRRRRPTRSLV